MTVLERNLIPFLVDIPLMQGVNEKALHALVPSLEVLSFELGSIIFNEGDLSNDLYIIFKGEVTLLKNSEHSRSQHVLGKLTQGEMFGEFSFIDDSPRSCSIQASQHVILIKLARSHSTAISPYEQGVHETILRNITAIVIRRMREANIKASRSKEIEIRKSEIKIDLTKLLIVVLTTLLAAAGLSGMLYLAGADVKIFALSNWLAVAIALACVLIFAKWHHYPLQEFGLKATFGSFFLGQVVSVASLCILLLGTIFYVLSYFKGVVPISRLPPWFLVGLYLPYACLTEFLWRGVVQTLIEKLTFKSAALAICYTSFLAGACNTYFGPLTMVLVLLINVLCGCLYVYAKNIFMPAIVHICAVLLLQYLGFLHFVNLI